MIKSIIGWILVTYPIVIASFFFIYNLEYSWYFSENYKTYDLIYSILGFTGFLIGVKFVSKNKNKSLLVIITTAFIIYQILGWEFDAKRSLSSIKINQSYSMHLVPHDGGAFTSTTFVRLILIEKKYPLLISTNKEINRYNNIYSGQLTFKNNNFIDVKLTTFSKESISDSINIKDVLNNL